MADEQNNSGGGSGGTSVGNIFFRLGVKADKFKEDLAKAKEDAEKAFGTDPLEKFNNKLRDTDTITRALDKQIMKIGLTMAAAFSINKIMEYSKECMSLANTQAFVEQKLATVMEQRMNATDEEIQKVKDLASALQDVGTIGDEVALSGAAQFATYTDSANAVLSLLPSMENLAMSMTDGNVDANSMKSVADMVGKAMANNSLGSLTRAGITFTDEEVARWDTLINDEEKAAFLAEVIKNNVGDINGSLSEQLITHEQLNNKVGDIKEKLGSIAQVFVVPMQKMLLSLANMADNVLGKICDVLGVKMIKAENQTNSATSAASKYLDNALKKSKELQASLMGFDKIQKLGLQKDEDSFSELETIGSENGDITKSVRFEYDENSFAARISNSLQKIGEGISKYIGDKFGIAFNEETIEKFVAKLEELGGWIEQHPDEFADLIDSVIRFIVTLAGLFIIVKVCGWLFSLGSAIGGVIEFVVGLVSSLGGLGSICAGLGAILVSPWTLLIAVIGAVVAALIYAWDDIVDAWNTFRSLFTNWDEWKQAFSDVGDWFLEGFGKLLDDLWNGFWDLLGGIARYVSDWWSGLWDDKKDVEVNVRGNYSGNYSGENLGEVGARHFATGGYVRANTPTLAVVGDNRREGEFISTETQMQKIIEKTGGMDSKEVVELLKQILTAILSLNLEANVDVNSLYKLIVRIAKQEGRATGRPSFG